MKNLFGRNVGKRYYISPAFDLLKLVYFFSAVKTHIELDNSPIPTPVPKITYAIIMQKKDLPIIKMYDDVVHSEKVERLNGILQIHLQNQQKKTSGIRLTPYRLLRMQMTPTPITV